MDTTMRDSLVVVSACVLTRRFGVLTCSNRCATGAALVVPVLLLDGGHIGGLEVALLPG
jgi:hypothetical protein